MANKEKKSAGRLPGFYIALCCCVLVIGIAGYFTERKTKEPTTDNNINLTQEDPNQSADNADENYSDGEVISVSEISPIEEATAEPVVEETPAEEAVPQQEFEMDNPDIMETAVKVEAEEEYYAFPASGEILAPFSSSLAYNELLGDYRTHNGIDIAADEGCSISAAADGTVEEIFSDAFGDGITISHGNGVVTKYMCLGAVEDLKTGDSVKIGDVLGTVGKSKGETTQEPHLHFEMYRNNEVVDPSQYLK